jgi:hypothetical protein
MWRCVKKVREKGTVELTLSGTDFQCSVLLICHRWSLPLDASGAFVSLRLSQPESRMREIRKSGF